MVQYPPLSFFPFMPAQPQQADRYIMIDHIVLSLMPVDGQTVHMGQSQNSLFLLQKWNE